MYNAKPITGVAKEPVANNQSNEQLVNFLYHNFWLVDVLVVLVILLGSYYFLLKPKYDEIMSAKEVVAQMRDYEQKQEYFSSIKKLNNVYDDIPKKDKDKLNEIVNVSSDNTSIYQELQYLITDKGMTPLSIDPFNLDANYEFRPLSSNTKGGPLIAGRKLVKTVIQISNANYKGLYKLVERMELNLRIMDITKISYDPFLKIARLEVLTYKQ